MVIAHDDVDAETPGQFDLAMTDSAAVDGDHEPCAGLSQAAHSRLVQPVAVAQSMRDVQDGISSERAEEAQQEGAAADSVDVIIAVDAHPLAARQRGDDPIRRAPHVAKQHRRTEVGR